MTVRTRRAGSDDPLVGREDVKALHAEREEASPDATTGIDELAADGDAMVFWLTMRGTRRGAFRGIDPTGTEVEVDGFSFRRVRDGRVVEARDVPVVTSLLAQLGVDLPFRTDG